MIRVRKNKNPVKCNKGVGDGQRRIRGRATLAVLRSRARLPYTLHSKNNVKSTDCSFIN